MRGPRDDARACGRLSPHGQIDLQTENVAKLIQLALGPVFLHLRRRHHAQHADAAPGAHRRPRAHARRPSARRRPTRRNSRTIDEDLQGASSAARATSTAPSRSCTTSAFLTALVVTLLFASEFTPLGVGGVIAVMFVASMVCLSTAFLHVPVRSAHRHQLAAHRRHQIELMRRVAPIAVVPVRRRRGLRHRPQRPRQAAHHGAGAGIRAAFGLAPPRSRQHAVSRSAGRTRDHRARAALRARARGEHQGAGAREVLRRAAGRARAGQLRHAMGRRRQDAPDRSRARASCPTRPSSPGTSRCPSSNYRTPTATRPRPAGSTDSRSASSASPPARCG